MTDKKSAEFIAYSDEDLKSSDKMLNIFIGAKIKYHMFDYINKSMDPHPYRVFMCESLFRHTILELYATFFDLHTESISYHLIKKFKRNCKIELTQATNKKLTNLLKNISNYSIRLNTYRNNNLAHKSSISKQLDSKNDYHFKSEDFSKLILITEELILAILERIKPTTAYGTDLLGYADYENNVRSFFAKMSEANLSPLL